MSDDLPSVTGPIDTIRKGPRQRSFVGLAAAIVGLVLSVVGFYAVIIEALNDAGTGPNLSLVILLLGLAFLLIGLVIGVIGLIAHGKKLVPAITLVVVLAPVVLFIGTVISARM
jgi:hypothetical protein